MPTPVNHGPLAVLNVLGVALPDEGTCKAVKAKYGIVSRPHDKGAVGGRTPGSAFFGLESHHILQNAAVKGLVTRGGGQAVLLQGTEGGLHDQINAQQVARNCPGPGPKTFGELVKASRDDLNTAWEKSMGKEDAKTVSDCLTIEAVKQAQQDRKNEEKAALTPSDKVNPVAGCFRAGTRIGLESGAGIRAEDIVVGTVLWGGLRVERTEACTASMVEVTTEAGSIALAGAHRVKLASGALVRADRVRAGQSLATVSGPAAVLAVRRRQGFEVAHTFGFASAASIPAGECGVWAAMPVLGPPVHATLDITAPRGARTSHHAAA
jgi:hypothetical protein